MKISRLIVVDGNAPWVRSLFLAMPPEISVRFLRIGQPNVFRKLSDQSWPTARRWQPCGQGASERWIIIPGWGKAPSLSSWLTKRAVKTAIEDPAATAVIFTLPFYAPIAETSRCRSRVYYAHDPFEFYDWDKQRTRELESRMLDACDVTFAISRALRDDLTARTNRPVLNSPNAVSSSFVAAMRNMETDIPGDLAGISRPIIGCTGQINETYDWPMLAELANLMPDVSFVFIGPILAETPEQRSSIDAVLKGRPNVHWLGPKPHADLPVYLRAFDVCLNPLAPGAHADRRSPLRLYDFLATGKPVVSTAIAEADSHEGQVWIGKDAAELEQIIRSSLSGQRRVDAKQRREYLQRNTWEFRARRFLEMIELNAATG